MDSTERVLVSNREDSAAHSQSETEVAVEMPRVRKNQASAQSFGARSARTRLALVDREHGPVDHETRFRVRRCRDRIQREPDRIHEHAS